MAFSLSAEQIADITFVKLQSYCDALVAELFQGDAKKYNFSDEVWSFVFLANKQVLIKVFDAVAK